MSVPLDLPANGRPRALTYSLLTLLTLAGLTNLKAVTKMLLIFPADVTKHIRMDVQTDIGHVV